MKSFVSQFVPFVFFALTGPFIAAHSTSALADAFPSRPVKIIVGQGAGTTSDILARLVATKLGASWSEPVVIEGHAGAAGTVAATLVAKAAPDGHMLLLASSTNLGVAALSVERVQYDPIRDFAPIGRIARVPWALGVNAKIPVKTLPELIAYAKANPGRLTGGSTGPGSAASFGIDTLSRKAGIDILNVPYRASALAIQAVVAGEVDMIFTDLALLEPHVKAGTIRLLAAASAKRLRDYPNLPTLAEHGIGGIVIEPWNGLVAPAGTPPAVLSALSDALTRALRSGDIRAQILGFGYEPIEETPAEFAAAIAADIARFSGSDRSADLQPARGGERPAATPPPSAPSPAR